MLQVGILTYSPSNINAPVFTFIDATATTDYLQASDSLVTWKETQDRGGGANS